MRSIEACAGAVPCFVVRFFFNSFTRRIVGWFLNGAGFGGGKGDCLERNCWHAWQSARGMSMWFLYDVRRYVMIPAHESELAQVR